jgi:hypothetical protein
MMISNTENIRAGAPSKLCLGGGLTIVSNLWRANLPAQAELGRGTRVYR